MNRYEGMFILLGSSEGEEVEAALGRVRAEIEKLGGEVDSTTRLGKRAFARPLKKREAGQYAVLSFRLDGGKLDALRARYKLSEDVLRVQFIRLKETTEAADSAEAPAESKAGKE